jgi:hypothetical protein
MNPRYPLPDDLRNTVRPVPSAASSTRRRRFRRAMVAALPALAIVIGAGCTSDDDGAQVRDSGGVVSIVGPAPESGGSVSATGTGCSTRGSTTRLPSSSITVRLDDGSLEAPATATEGVIRFVAKNFGSMPHELWVVKAAAVDEIPTTAGRVDEETMGDLSFWRIRSFPGNTICQGLFTLEPGTYLLFDDLLAEGAATTNLAAGMIATLTVVGSTAPSTTFTLPTNPDGSPVLAPVTEP